MNNNPLSFVDPSGFQEALPFGPTVEADRYRWGDWQASVTAGSSFGSGGSGSNFQGQAQFNMEYLARHDALIVQRPRKQSDDQALDEVLVTGKRPPTLVQSIGAKLEAVTAYLPFEKLGHCLDAAAFGSGSSCSGSQWLIGGAEGILEAGLFIVGGPQTTVAAKGLAPQIAKIEKQLSQHGRSSVERSLGSLEKRLAEHRQALETYRAQGGYTSSVEREIRAFEAEIQAIQEVLGRGP